MSSIIAKYEDPNGNMVCARRHPDIEGFLVLVRREGCNRRYTYTGEVETMVRYELERDNIQRAA